MATVLGGGQVKLNNGSTVAAQNGGWYDGQQYINGTLSATGVINSQSSQQGAGQAVSQAVVAQTDKAQGLAPGTNEAFIAAANPSAASGSSSTGTGGGATGTTTPTLGGNGASVLGGTFGSANAAINLPDLYTSLTNAAGIPAMQQQITAAQTAFNTAQSQINDNPFLSEADRTGRIEKLTTDYNNDTQTLQNSMTMAQQDVSTQLQLQTQQFDINSQQSQDALAEFNTLLSSGALAGASGSDIAAITAATGISSTEIQAAIQSQTVKDTPTSVTTVDDGTNQYAVVMNTQTGAIISKTVLGGSAIAAQTNANIKEATATAALTPASASSGSTSSSSSTTAAELATANEPGLITDIKNKITLQSLVDHYQSVIPVATIYADYNQYSPWGTAKETLAQVKAGEYDD